MDAILCYKTQMQLLGAADTRTALSPECQAHLRECAECRAYAKTLALVDSTHIHAALDAETLRRAKAALPARRRRHTWRWVACAAVLAVLCALAVFLTHSDKTLVPARKSIIISAVERHRPSSAELDVLALAANYAQANDDLSQMNLELDILLSELN